MKVDIYKLMSRCVEEGVDYGIARAKKHTDNPSDDELANAINDAIMIELCEYLDFDNNEQPSLNGLN